MTSLTPTRTTRWTTAAATTLVWALAAAGTVYWSLRLTAPAPGGSIGVVADAAPPPADAGALARLLGAGQAAPAAAAPALSSRFVLQGVIAGRGTGGAALIAIDGKPARPYRVGARLEDGVVLQSVDVRGAVLAAAMDGPAATTLALPALAALPTLPSR